MNGDQPGQNGVSVSRTRADEPSILDGPQWYCVRSQPKREHFAGACLRQIEGIEIFCPRIRFRKLTRRGPVWFLEAMFPGYLFARFDFVHLHARVRHSAAVTGILQFGKRVVIVGDDVVESLRERVGGEGDIPVVEVDPSIKVGDPVNIAAGAFMGLESVVTRLMSGKERVRVLIEFLGRQMEVELGKELLVQNESARAWL